MKVWIYGIFILMNILTSDCEAMYWRNRRHRGKRWITMQWTDWSSVPSGGCSKICGGGTEIETRGCLFGISCTGPSTRTRSCNTQPCPGWSSWIEWGQCSRPCGLGLQTLRRTCNGGNCDGQSFRKKTCFVKACPVQNGHWSDWVKAGRCSKPCGGGKQAQRRTCTSPAPRNGGRDCSGDSSRSIDCNLQPCPVDGQWSAWVNRGNCTEPCGGGKQLQKRFCNNPAPQKGGSDCEGEHIRLIYCNQQACKVDGKWTAWINDGACSKTCDGGTGIQNRTCTHPPPQNGGKECTGPSSRVINCNSQPCKDLPEAVCESRGEFRGCYVMMYYSGICQTDHTVEQCLSKAFIYKDEDNNPVATIDIAGASHVLKEGQTFKDGCTFHLRNLTLSVNETICEFFDFGR